MVSLAIWTLTFATILALLRGLLGPRHASCALKWVLLPGALVGIASRLLGCAASRAPVKAIHPPWRAGPLVVCDRPGVPVAGPILLAMVPLVLAMTAVLILRSRLAPELACHAELPAVAPHAEAIGTLLGTTASVVGAADEIAVSPLARQWSSLAFGYLALSVLVFAAPSLAEWRVLAMTLGSVILLGAGCNYLGVRAGFLSRGWFLERALGAAGHEALGLLVATGTLSLAAVAAAACCAALARGLRGREEKGRKK